MTVLKVRVTARLTKIRLIGLVALQCYQDASAWKMAGHKSRRRCHARDEERRRSSFPHGFFFLALLEELTKIEATDARGKR